MANKPPADDLSALLDSYDGAKVNPPDKTGAEDEWIEKFNAHREKVIRPTMEALGKEIEKRGHDFHIVARDFRRGNRPQPDEASIRIDIYLADEKTRTRINADKRPHVGFSTNHKKQTVNVTICDVTSRGGVESKVAELPLDKVDAALIKDKFVALFKRLVAA
jgi:hypothetical protein